MASWVIAYQDDFNRADGALGGAWDALNISIVSNRCRTSGNYGRAFWTGDTETWDAKQAAACFSDGGGESLGVRCADKNNGYYLTRSSTVFQIRKFVSGSPTQLGSNGTANVQARIGATADGTTIKIHQGNWTLGVDDPDAWETISGVNYTSMSVTDATFADGKPLLMGGLTSGNNVVDDWYSWKWSTGGSGGGTSKGVMGGGVGGKIIG